MMRFELVDNGGLERCLSYNENSRRGGWLEGWDIIVIEGSSKLKARVRWVDPLYPGAGHDDVLVLWVDPLYLGMGHGDVRSYV